MRNREALINGHQEVYALSACGCFRGNIFFTVALADRKDDLLVREIVRLRTAMRTVKQRHPFEIVAMVVMPDHMHALWRLPPDDADYPMRWSLIKSAFSRSLPKVEHIRHSRELKRERGIWQRRYWEHLIRDESDLQAHADYIHFNPGQAWLCDPCNRLAVFDIASLCSVRLDASGLGVTARR